MFSSLYKLRSCTFLCLGKIMFSLTEWMSLTVQIGSVIYEIVSVFTHVHVDYTQMPAAWSRKAFCVSRKVMLSLIALQAAK